jgi:hypothetical protein
MTAITAANHDRYAELLDAADRVGDWALNRRATEFSLYR